mmetsp:Transcript_72304/g.157000  ORF Transcript_72304/g.157000 Transcript_72304/m.157000 type:complete len:218 (+) Transcript_72304:3066-3719(+)
MAATHDSLFWFEAGSAMRKTRGSKAGQPLGGPRLPRGSSVSQTYSANLDTTSPIFVCILGKVSTSKRRRSSDANSILCAAESLGKQKSFSGPLLTSCRNKIASCLRTVSSTSGLPSTASIPIIRLVGSDCFACWYIVSAFFRMSSVGDCRAWMSSTNLALSTPAIVLSLISRFRRPLGGLLLQHYVQRHLPGGRLLPSARPDGNREPLRPLRANEPA